MKFKKIHTALTVLGNELEVYNNYIDDSYLYLIAGVHGNEPEGVFVLAELFAWLQSIDLTTAVIVIPILNPDGYKAETRCNANQVDLNRNLPASNWSADYEQANYNPGPKPLSEPENQMLVKLLSKYNPHTIISFHSWKPLLNINAKAEILAGHIARFNNYHTTQDIGYPTPGSLDSYATEKYNCAILTYECPELSSGLSLEEIWAENEHGLKDVFLNYF